MGVGQGKINHDLTGVLVQLAENDTWLTAHELATLFQISLHDTVAHIDLIYEEKELDAAITRKNLLKPQGAGFQRVDHYDFDVIISLGYRIKSSRGKEIRQWFTKTLQEYMVKGFALDDERLKNPDAHKRDRYFDELLDRTSSSTNSKF